MATRARPAAARPVAGQTLRVRPDELHTYHRNARRGDVAVIAASLRVNGQYRPICVNIGTHTGRPMEVLAGNHTLMALRENAETHPDDPRWDGIDAHYVDVDEDRARAIVLADNRTAELGTTDADILWELVSAMPDLEGTGYNQDDMDALAALAGGGGEPLTDPDDTPPVPADPVTEVGQVWTLGAHRLLVGDATDLAGLRRLCGGTAPDAVWTDPPYGVDYVGGKSHRHSPSERKRIGGKSIQNDGKVDLPALLAGAFAGIVAVCRPGAPVYVAHADTERIASETALRDAGVLVRQNLVWVKQTIVMGRSDYHYRHEPILYGFTPNGDGRLGRGGDRWCGDNSQTTVFEFDRPSRGGKVPDHPTMKPVALIDAMLANSLPPGGVVLDPFAGSGTTLIAAHGRGARAFCVELDPLYADVILRRFEEHTGVTPELDGVPVTFARSAANA